MEILNTYTDLKFSTWILGSIGIFGSISSFVFVTRYLTDIKSKKLVISFLSLVFCVFAFIAYTKMIDNGIGIYTYHEVMLSKDDKIDAFKYDIIKTKGKIIVIREKETN